MPCSVLPATYMIAPGPTCVDLAVHGDLTAARCHDQKLLLGMAMRRMRCGAGIEHGHADTQTAQLIGRSVVMREDLASIDRTGRRDRPNLHDAFGNLRRGDGGADDIRGVVGHGRIVGVHGSAVCSLDARVRNLRDRFLTKVFEHGRNADERLHDGRVEVGACASHNVGDGGIM